MGSTRARHAFVHALTLLVSIALTVGTATTVGAGGDARAEDGPLYRLRDEDTAGAGRDAAKRGRNMRAKQAAVERAAEVDRRSAERLKAKRGHKPPRGIEESALGSVKRVKDIRWGPKGSKPAWLTVVGDTVFFTADTAKRGRELWKSDGTRKGTKLVRDIRPGPEDAWIDALVVAGGTLFFAADDGTHGSELWTSDGTWAGTRMVKDIRPGPLAAQPLRLVAARGLVFFTADDGANGWELWRSDGTSAGTMRLTDLLPGDRPDTPSFGPSWLTNVRGTLFFNGRDEEHGHELWKSDGTKAGTTLVKDIAIVSEPERPNKHANPTRLAAVGDTLFFSATDGTVVVIGEDRFGNPTEQWPADLYQSDGTLAGTKRVKDFDSLANECCFWSQDVDGTLFFFFGAPRGLWTSDGTAAGTKRVKGVGGHRIKDVAGVAYFVGSVPPDVDQELWKSDGTTAGTQRVRDIRPGQRSSMPRHLVPFGERLFFAADDGQRGKELWVTKGTPATTKLVAGIRPGPRGSMPRDDNDSEVVNADLKMVKAGRKLFFVANDGQRGQELWVWTPGWAG